MIRLPEYPGSYFIRGNRSRLRGTKRDFLLVSPYTACKVQRRFTIRNCCTCYRIYITFPRYNRLFQKLSYKILIEGKYVSYHSYLNAVNHLRETECCRGNKIYVIAFRFWYSFRVHWEKCLVWITKVLLLKNCCCV